MRSLCVINYDGVRVLDACLRPALAQRDSFREILVVDNGSTDASVEHVKSHYPEVRIVQLPDNRGPGAARNAALREAACDRVLLLDNDVALKVGCAEQLDAALDCHPRAVAAMPSVVYAGRPDTVQYDGAANHYLGQMLLHHENVPCSSLRPLRAIGSIVTACVLVDRARLGPVEAFDESFFIYFEDHDFGVRARSLGHELLSVPSAVCLHGQGTEGLSLRQLGHYSERRVSCIIRNRWMFLAKNYSLRSLVLLSPMLATYELAQLALAVRKGWLRPWWSSCTYVLAHAGEILERRRWIQAQRTVPDRELFEGGRLPFRDELTTSAAERTARAALDALVGCYWRCVAGLV